MMIIITTIRKYEHSTKAYNGIGIMMFEFIQSVMNENCATEANNLKIFFQAREKCLFCCEL